MDFPLDVTSIAIETDRLLLRAFAEFDLEDFYAYASVPGVGEMAGWPHHTSIETTKAILKIFLENKNELAIFHKADNKVIGSLGLHNAWINREDEYKHLKAKNIGYVLAKDYWGQGLMSEAVNAVISYGFYNLGMDAFSIEHFVENMQSKRVIEKCGFKFVKEGKYHAKQLDKYFDELRYVLVNYAYASIDEVRKAYMEKRTTVTEVTMQHLSRIARIDAGPDGLKSVIEINPDVLFIAKALDLQLEGMDTLPPLFGIPVLLKDNVNTMDRLHTTAGSVALADNYAPYDAHIVTLLREAGAIIIGKANMTEFANYMTREGMPSGYSSRGGQVLNPYNRDKTPSGSSSGSAVAVAAGLCTVSIGTETSGSIISPAGNNGIVGIKPTMGLVSRSGIIPISSTFDTSGPMTRTVSDAAVLLSVIAGPDPDDAATYVNTNDDADYTKYLVGGRLGGIRVGLNRKLELKDVQDNPDDIAAFDQICNLLTEQGAVLVDDLEMQPHYDTRGTVMQHEFKACMDYYLSTLAGSTKMRTLRDIIEYNQANAPVALKYGQSLLLDAENKVSGAFTEPKYLEALAKREQSILEMDKLFDKNNVDILLGQTFAYIAPFTGFPSITFPIGQRQDNNMPVQAYFAARRFDEAMLIRVAYIIEQALGLRMRPE